MKHFSITLIVLIAAVLICAVREDRTFHILHTLPFLGGQTPGIHDIGGIVLLLLALWGWSRLKHRK